MKESRTARFQLLNWHDLISWYWTVQIEKIPHFVGVVDILWANTNRKRTIVLQSEVSFITNDLGWVCMPAYSGHFNSIVSLRHVEVSHRININERQLICHYLLTKMAVGMVKIDWACCMNVATFADNNKTEGGKVTIWQEI